VSAPLVLASTSPRRAELLSLAGVEFEALAAPVDEDGITADLAAASAVPSAIALELALAKGRAAAALRPGARVLAADTIVVLDGELLGKPRDPAEADLMLSRLSGRGHEVITAFVLVEPDGTERAGFESTMVHFARWSAAARAAYVSGGEPFDKAGGYGIQGPAGAFVERVDGDWFNIMGLPLARVLALLRG
jgi:septum formation protein